jgi:hypothetical protein
MIDDNTAAALAAPVSRAAWRACGTTSDGSGPLYLYGQGDLVGRWAQHWRI